MSRPKRMKITDAVKDSVGRKCVNCGSIEDLVYHHIVPLSMGGNDVISNLTCLCGACHNLIHYDGRGVISNSVAVRNGLRAAKARGVKLGKPGADDEKVMQLIAEKSTQFNMYSETTEHEIMEIAGVKETCYYRCKKKLVEAMKADKWPYQFKKPKQVRAHPLYDEFIKRERGY